MTPLERARTRYADLAGVLVAMTAAHWPRRRGGQPLVACRRCARVDRETEAASLAYDNAVAWTFSGRHPRGQVRR